MVTESNIPLYRVRKEFEDVDSAKGCGLDASYVESIISPQGTRNGEVNYFSKFFNLILKSR